MGYCVTEKGYIGVAYVQLQHHAWCLVQVPTNISRVFHVETTWKRLFLRPFNVGCTWCVCRKCGITSSGVPPWSLSSSFKWQNFALWSTSLQLKKVLVLKHFVVMCHFCFKHYSLPKLRLLIYCRYIFNLPTWFFKYFILDFLDGFLVVLLLLLLFYEVFYEVFTPLNFREKGSHEAEKVWHFYININDQCSHYIETSQLICSADQLTGFYIMETLVVKGLSAFVKNFKSRINTLQLIPVLYPRFLSFSSKFRLA